METATHTPENTFGEERLDWFDKLAREQLKEGVQFVLLAIDGSGGGIVAELHDDEVTFRSFVDEGS